MNKKSILQNVDKKLLLNALELYSASFESIMSEHEAKILIDKLSGLIKQDVIKKFSRTNKAVPFQVLKLIYFIGEYKKAYLHSKDDSKKQRTNTLEALGKGLQKRKEKAKELRQISRDENMDISTRSMALYSRILLIAFKNKAYSKTGLLILGYFFLNFPFHKHIMLRYFAHKKHYVESLQYFEDALHLFEYTYLSRDKIINSLLIVVYSQLVQLGIEKNEAYRASKDIVRTFLDDENLTDKFRHSLLDKDIYFAGVYNGLPIFQYYTGKDDSYYIDKDVRQIQRFFKLFIAMQKQSKQLSSIFNTTFKLMMPNTPVSFDRVVSTFEADIDVIKSVMLSNHLTFVRTPFYLFDKVTPYKITLITKLKSLCLHLRTTFAVLITKSAH
jgi:hypothetical protein